MTKVLEAKQIFKRNYFKTYSEFLLALAIGNVVSNRGYCLSMDSMQVDVSAIPQDMIKYYKRLLSDGALVMSMYERKPYEDEVSSYDIDTSYFDKIPLLKEENEGLSWTIDYAQTSYKDYTKKFMELNVLGYTLMHLVAYHLVNSILNEDKRKLKLSFDSMKAKSTFIYVNIYSILQSMPWLEDIIELDVDFGDYKVDLDYSIFCSNGRVAGRYKLYSVSEKLEIMKKYGMVEGAILVLFERTGICKNNEYGHISGAKLLRLDEIGDDFIGVTFLALNRTKEEVRQDYYSIDESVRSLFVDMLDKKPHTKSTELKLFDLGIDNYFYNEGSYITLLDETETVYKLVTIEGKEVNVLMSAVDAIYWLLCQYEIDFDATLYKNIYNHGKDLLWDEYN